MSTQYPQALNDYTCIDEYQDHKGNVLLWAWEFIRRNAEYQRLWDAADQASSEPQAYALARTELVSKFGDWGYCWRSGTNIVARNATVQNLYNLPPIINAAPSGAYSDLYVHPDLDDHPFELPVTLTFDASLASDQQLKEASRILKSIRNKSDKGRIAKAPTANDKPEVKVHIPKDGITLLRILDALATTPTPIDAEIKRALGWSADNTATALRQAKEKALSLRDGNAQSMPLSGKYRAINND